MEATADFSIDQQYFEAVYSEWRRYRSRWRRFAIPLTLLVLITGIALLWFLPAYRVFGIALIIGSVFQGYDAATHRSRWIRERLKDLPPDKYAKVTFRDDHIEIKTPNSEGRLNFRALSDIVPTPGGIFLLPQTGVSIFVPRSSIHSTEAIAEIVTLIRTSIDHPSSQENALA